MKTKQFCLRLAVCGTVLALMLTVCSSPPLMSLFTNANADTVRDG